jgi:hypothetical protein
MRLAANRLPLNAMTENTCYSIAELDSNGRPVRYLPFLAGWQPTMPYWLTNDRAEAWRFRDREAAQETLDVMNSNPATHNPTLRVIEIDCDGPPLTLPTPPTLQ